MAGVNIDFAKEIKKYGAGDFTACFNCGTCTAICNLTDKEANFPRQIIRQGMLGQTEAILGSKELWLCYACGECTETCPRQAAPGEFMAAMRRYAIASYEPTGLTKLLFKNNYFSIIITLAVAVMLGFFLLTLKPETIVARWIFRYLPYDVIHHTGIAIFILTGISVFWGMARMITKSVRNSAKPEKKTCGRLKAWLAAIREVGDELAVMRRYRSCDKEEDDFWKQKSLVLRPWAVHWSIMWGFIGLLVATILDFIFKNPAATIWLPSRILGTFAGLFLLHGTTTALYYRIRKITKAYSATKLADWMFLIFLWLAGFTGFWLEIAVTFNDAYIINEVVFAIHTIISMELVLLFAFSKFAHATYRPLALLIYYHRAA
jgi:ferredoxin